MEPKDISTEAWREYDFGGRVYRIAIILNSCSWARPRIALSMAQALHIAYPLPALLAVHFVGRPIRQFPFEGLKCCYL
jgi:hypothetical protein